MWIQNSTGLALLQMFSSGEAEARLEPSLLKINCMDLKHPTGCSNCLLSINVTIITKYHKLGGLKEQKCDLTQVWRLEGQDQGVSRAMIPLKALGEDLSLPLSGFRWLHAIPAIPWFMDISFQSLSPLSHGILPVCLYLLFL